jgi:hypothetical protein
MTIFNFKEAFDIFRGEMAKTRRTVDEALVAAFAERLRAVGSDRPAFDSIFAELNTLKAAELGAIAQRYVGGGKKVNTKSAALALIRKRFVEIIRFHSKNKVAEKTRPW